MKERTVKLIENLKDSFDGEPWYGISLMKKLNSLDYKIVGKTSSLSSNYIAKLVLHIINWKVFVLEKLKGNVEYNIEMNSENDWSDINIETEAEWNQLLNKLVSTQSEIIEILESKTNDDYLDNEVLGKKYTMEYIVKGTTQHDIYHLGQIAILSKQ